MKAFHAQLNNGRLEETVGCRWYRLHTAIFFDVLSFSKNNLGTFGLHHCMRFLSHMKKVITCPRERENFTAGLFNTRMKVFVYLQGLLFF